MKNIMRKARGNHEIFEALYDAFKWSNRFNEKMLRVEEIRTNSSRELHYSLKEETEELRVLLNKASKKILYLNYLCGETLLNRHYSHSERMDMVFDFIDFVTDEIKCVEKMAS